jgi:hypothetical protein
MGSHCGPGQAPYLIAVVSCGPPCCCWFVSLLLVCAACPVSVSVRPERFCVSESTRDSGHHSRFVQSFLLLATAAPVLASMALPVGSRFIEVSLFTRCSAGRDLVAVLQRARGERARTWTALRGQDDDGPVSPSRGVITCASQRKSLSAEALFTASLPAVAGVVTR